MTLYMNNPSIFYALTGFERYTSECPGARSIQWGRLMQFLSLPQLNEIQFRTPHCNMLSYNCWLGKHRDQRNIGG